MAVSMTMGRDTKWLTLEVCREFQRGTCSRSDAECKFAHPSRSCHVENGRVIACFDSLKGVIAFLNCSGEKMRHDEFPGNLANCVSRAESLLVIEYSYDVGRCTRENCKYLHPPPHLKTQLEINGRNNLIQQKAAAAMLAQQMQFMLPGAQLQPIKLFRVDDEAVLIRSTRENSAITCFVSLVSASLPLPQTTFPVTPSLATSPSMAFSPYLSHMGPGMGLMPELLPSTPLLVPGSPTGLAAMGNGTSAQKHVRTDKLEVCREFQRGNCTRGESDCRYAHPLEAGMVDCSENSVIVCMDYIKGRCSRDKCKYFHPPAHLQARIKAAQHQASQNTASAALGLPPGAMQSLPKRPILEKSNGAAATVFNPSMFHYQQALANMQLQQPAFIPTGSHLCLLHCRPLRAPYSRSSGAPVRSHGNPFLPRPETAGGGSGGVKLSKPFPKPQLKSLKPAHYQGGHLSECSKHVPHL
ncbi:hypothetical protein L3Q82_020490, partial [Scortum barcoo]